VARNVLPENGARNVGVPGNLKLRLREMDMNTKNSLMISALTLALGFGSSLVLADTTNTNAGGDQTAASSAAGDNGAAAANDDSVAVAIDDINVDASDNSDNSTNDSNNDNSDNSVNVADSFNDNSDNRISVADSGNDNSNNSTNDSNNDNSDNSTNVDDSFNVTDSGNTDNSVRVADSGNTTDSGNLTVQDSFNSLATNYIVATTSNLAATVTDNYVRVGQSATYRSVNRIGDGAFASLAGISQIAQNSGVGSVNQQNVSVQAELSLGN